MKPEFRNPKINLQFTASRVWLGSKKLLEKIRFSCKKLEENIVYKRPLSKERFEGNTLFIWCPWH
jgi:hypothetical protein